MGARIGCHVALETDVAALVYSATQQELDARILEAVARFLEARA
jgi:hypothetical protein